MAEPANFPIGRPAWGGQVNVNDVSSLLMCQRQGRRARFY
jgi:hypothetical protein